MRQVEDVGSGAKDRPGRESLLKAARRREIDVVVVWRLDRWGRSLPDLVVTLRELTDLGVGFVSLTEALDLTTPTGRAMAGMLAVFAEFEREILRERVRAGIAQARKEGRPHGRPRTASLKADEVLRLKAERREPLGDRAAVGDRPDLGADGSWPRADDRGDSPSDWDTTEGPRSTWAALDHRASGPCRTVPGTIMPTGHGAFQTHSTGRLRGGVGGRVTTLDLIIPLPLLNGPVTAGNEETMEDSEENGPLDVNSKRHALRGVSR